MKQLFIGAVIISSLGGSYFLLNPQESQTDSVLESTAENNTAPKKSWVDFLPINHQTQNIPQTITTHSPKKENKHPLNLETLVANPMANKTIISKNIAAIAQCPSCLESLKHTLLTANLSREELLEFTFVLTQGNHPEIAKMLLSTATQMMTESGNTENSDTLISALASFNSLKVADVFAQSLISDEFNSNNLSNSTLESTLRKTINLMTDRQAIGDNLTNLYLNTNSSDQREKLLAIQQPESLVQISVTLSKQGDSQTAESILTQLQNNPSPYTATALLKLTQTEPASSIQSSNLTELATTWAKQYAQNEAVNLMENKLVVNKLSSHEENLVISMLQHSSDERAQVVVSKYMSYKNQAD